MNKGINNIRNRFPILDQQVNNRPLVYLDNAATTQKPDTVIRAVSRYYETTNSNVHRGVHTLSQNATQAFENSRKAIQHYINAAHGHEIIFTRGTTESINLVAFSFGERYVNAGDEILITGMEHHSNIVPWQMLAERKSAILKVLPVTPAGELRMDKLDSLITNKTRILAVTHVSNALGTINPVREIIQKAHARDVPVLIDGAQAMPHLKVDVQDLDADFYCFSAHKMYGPTGIGALYGKEKYLEEMPPWQGGGEMIQEVSFQKTTYNQLPYKFEAGTPHMGGVAGLEAAISFLASQEEPLFQQTERELLQYATRRLEAIPGLVIYGRAQNKSPVISFLIKDIHPFDAGTILNQLGIAVRTGHHCTQPLMKTLGIPGTLRASFAIYNTKEEIDQLAAGIEQAKKMLL